MHILVADIMSHVVEHDLLKIVTPTIHHGGEWHFTNQMLMTLIVGILMWLIFPRLFDAPRSDAPTGARNFFEAIIEFLRVEVFRPALKEHTDRFLPFLWTMFFFILFSNLLGLIPFATIIELITWGKIEHIGGTATGNIWNTAALAIVAFVMIHANGILQITRDLMHGTYGHHDAHEEHSSNGMPGHEAAMDIDHMRGEALAADIPQKFQAMGDPTKHYADDEHVSQHGHSHVHGGAAGAVHHNSMPALSAFLIAVPLYIWNFAPHPFRPGQGESRAKWIMDLPVWFMLLLLEILGAFIKPFALAIRLFANMIAGHLVLAALLSLIVAIHGFAQLAIGVPVGALSFGIYLLEIFVAFLQAYIFVFLTTLFIASAVAPEH